MAMSKNAAKMVRNMCLADLTPGRKATVAEFAQRVLELNRLIPSFSPLTSDGAAFFAALTEEDIPVAVSE